MSLRRRLLPAAVLALGLGIAAVGWIVTHTTTDARPRAERLAAAARLVAERDPKAFGGIEPLSPRELSAARPAAPATGAPVIVAPQGWIVGGRPMTRWSGLPLEQRVEVRVASAGGAAAWQRNAIGGVLIYPPEEPPLAPGEHLVTVRGLPGGQAATRAFRVADATRAQALAAATAAVNAHAPPDLRALLRGHAAARLGFLLEAEAYAQEALRDDPKDDHALDLLRYVHGSLGETEGWNRK